MPRLLLLRHATPLTDGRLAGRRDVAADLSDRAALDRMRGRIGTVARIISSPARRCVMTAQGLGLSPDALDERLWEQDYGAWEGLPFADLPDLGRLPLSDLARHRPDRGESFRDMAARVLPALQALSQDTLIIAHAGTVRAALSRVVGDAALSFAVAPLSLTILQCHEDWSVEAVNITAT
ncbi:histidine phosphatase family protein [Paracoccus fistulariae]|uniref:Histidine phosphatase family protein n=1 Tax=Paracoccus fistulariae TaxID=658446 RepID=A0ABY7SPC8_9RHOB|nr:histidine phosphatase family protein [Paracoccus fistulariae]MDB6180239.1 histidine phosphatase family protein [Paracoccus fistulariae]WCR08322.1 histidine phosphatase family protein [Paracoccus fistulariae]